MYIDKYEYAYTLYICKDIYIYIYIYILTIKCISNISDIRSSYFIYLMECTLCKRQYTIQH